MVNIAEKDRRLREIHEAGNLNIYYKYIYIFKIYIKLIY